MKKNTLVLAALAAFCAPVFGAEKSGALPVTNVASGWEIAAEKLPPLVVEGTNPEQGVAGAYAVFVPDIIFVMGGCNFPDKGPADGGKKVYFDTIWRFDTVNRLGWRVAEDKLPYPVAYSANGLGGENESGKLSATLGGGKLPVTIDNAATAGGFIAGGNINGVPANKAFHGIINSSPGKDPITWSPIPDFPGTPRVQPVAGMLKTPRGLAFALVGGFHYDKEKNVATLDRAGVIYYPQEKKWEKIPPIPESLSEAGLVGSVAISDNRGGILIFGGVNAKIFKDALEKPAPDYLRHEPSWYKFNADVLRLSFDKNGNAQWEKLATVPATARAGASAVWVSGRDIRSEKNEIFYICGELKPGFRSPDCTLIRLKKTKAE